MIRIQNIFLLDGMGGTGKSDFMKYVTRKFGQNKGARGAVVHKVTTRPKRKEEIEKKHHLDLRFVTPQTFESNKKKQNLYIYDFGGYLYGIRKDDISALIKSGTKHIFIIVKEKYIRDLIKRDFPGCRVLRVYIYSDKEEIKTRLQAEGYPEDHIGFRIDRISGAWFDYMEQSSSYEEIIINSSNKDDFHKIIDGLIEKYEGYPPDKLCIDFNRQYPLFRPFIGYKVEMLKRLERVDFDKNVFVMMKFRSKNKGLYGHIKSKLKAEGLNCVRADDPEWDITSNVYNPLAVLYCCRYGIALFDEAEPGNNFSPNVSYELGIMHYQHKDCLILKHKSLPTVPFDLIKDLHREYGDSAEAMTIIDEWISKLKR
jgi:guanylate kinase